MANVATPKLLTIAQAARLLHLNVVTLRKWDKEGKIKAYRLGPRGDRRFKKEDLMKLLAKDKGGDFLEEAKALSKP